MAEKKAKLDRGRRSLLLHGVLLAGAAAFATGMWLRDDEGLRARGDEIIWNADPDAVTRIAFEAEGVDVELTAKSDELGRFFEGVATRPETPVNPHNPHDPHGAPPADGGSEVTVRFVSVKVADAIADAVAPMRALRSLGAVSAEREAEFGLDAPEGTLRVEAGGQEHVLSLGARAVGSDDRYVRASDGQVYVIKGDILRDLQAADRRLMERDLHEFTAGDVTRAEIATSDGNLRVVRAGEPGSRFWALEPTPDQAATSAGTWLDSVLAIRPSSYEQPEAPTPVVRVDFFDDTGAIGFFELVRGASSDDGKPMYYVRSERTRVFGRVADTVGGPLEEDLASVLR